MSAAPPPAERGGLGPVPAGRRWRRPEPVAVPLQLATAGPGSRAEIVAYVLRVLATRTTVNPDTTPERLAAGIVTSILHRLGAGYTVAATGLAPTPGED